jgi:DNA-binding MarR family transcriptional regulator
VKEFTSLLPILTRSKYVYILCFMEKKTSFIAKNVLEEIERDCLCLQVRKTARMVTQWYDACLQPSGLRSTQFNVLVAIALAQTVTLTHLAKVLVLDRTTLARNLKPLESQGLVVVEPGEDRRVRLIRLTDRGYQLLEQSLPYWRKAQERVMARLGQSQWDALRADLRMLGTQVP